MIRDEGGGETTLLVMLWSKWIHCLAGGGPVEFLERREEGCEH